MISTRELAYRYAGGPELRFGDVEVAQGGLLLLRGASGSGKSTWLALAAGLLAPGGGDITVAGQSLKTLGGRAGDAWRAQTIGFLPQKLHLSAALTVHGNLTMARPPAIQMTRPALPKRWPRWMCRRWRSANRRSSQAARRSAWRWRARCCSSRG
jgi:ABC-type lipoprotein export system ATPase subunit